ncbi:MAG TPA: type II toxin-antitoxin system VapC family toxin [Pirellulaceae bacterium]|nr:type II toxin-antitoxin system VapC family toxin [Pirellulaceae bacterium]
MKPIVYLETSIIGYLASRRSRDLMTAANQQITHEWWDKHRQQYELYVSLPVLAECRAGDAAAAQERAAFFAGLPVLEASQPAEELAGKLIQGIPLPAKAHVDALHIALAAVNGIRFLLTWNCTHIANAALRSSIERSREFAVKPDMSPPRSARRRN